MGLSWNPEHTFACERAYVAVSRASVDTEVYTDDSAGLGEKLAHDVAKASAVKLRTYAPRMAPSLLHY